MNAATIAVEVAFCAALTYIGLVFLRGCGIGGFARYALAFVAGILVFVASMVLLVVSGLPTTPVVALAVASCVALGSWALTRRARGVGRRTSAQRGARWLRDAGAVLTVAVFVVLALPSIDAVTYIKHVDSFEYIAIAGMLTAQTLDEGVSLYQLQKRQLVVPALHAAARYGDAYYLRSVTPAIALSTLLFVVVMALASTRGPRAAAPTAWLVTLAVAVLGVGLLATHNRFVMHAFYINGHLLFGLLAVIVAGAAWLVARRAVDAVAGWSTLAGLALAVLQVTRVEAFVLTTALLVPILTSQRVPLVFKAATLAGYGVGVVVWHGYLVGLGITSLEVTGPLGIGMGALIALPMLPRLAAGLVRHGRWLRAGYLMGLLVALGVLAVRDPGLFGRSWSAFVANAVASDGYWGFGVLTLATVAVAAWLLLRDGDRVLMALPVFAFLPQAFVIAYLRDAAYRVGGGDSLNRMLIQVVPLMVVFVVVSFQGAMRDRLPRHATVVEEDTREVVQP